MDDQTVNVKMTLSEWRKYCQKVEGEDKNHPAARATNTASKARAPKVDECTCTGWSIEHTCRVHGDGVRSKVDRHKALVDELEKPYGNNSSSVKRPTQAEFNHLSKCYTFDPALEWKRWNSTAKRDVSPDISVITSPVASARTDDIGNAWDRYMANKPHNVESSSASGGGVKAKTAHHHPSNSEVRNGLHRRASSSSRPTSAPRSRSAECMVPRLPSVWSNHAAWTAFVEKEINSATLKTPTHWAKLFHKFSQAAYSQGCADAHGEGSLSKGTERRGDGWSSDSSIDNKFTPTESYDMASVGYTSKKSEQANQAGDDSSEVDGWRSYDPDSKPSPIFNLASTPYVPPVNHTSDQPVPPVMHLPGTTKIAANSMAGQNFHMSNNGPCPCSGNRNSLMHPNIYGPHTHQANNMPGPAVTPVSHTSGPFSKVMYAQSGVSSSPTAWQTRYDDLYAAYQAQSTNTAASGAFGEWPTFQPPTSNPCGVPSAAVPTGPSNAELRRQLQQYEEDNANLECQLDDQQSKLHRLQGHLLKIKTMYENARNTAAEIGVKSDNIPAPVPEDVLAPSTLSEESGPDWRLPAASAAGNDSGAAWSVGNDCGAVSPSRHGCASAWSASEGSVAASVKTYLPPQQDDYHITIVPMHTKRDPAMLGTVKYWPPNAKLTHNPMHNLLAITSNAVTEDVLEAYCAENDLDPKEHILVHNGVIFDHGQFIYNSRRKPNHANFEIVKLEKQDDETTEDEGSMEYDESTEDGW